MAIRKRTPHYCEPSDMEWFSRATSPENLSRMTLYPVSETFCNNLAVLLHNKWLNERYSEWPEVKTASDSPFYKLGRDRYGMEFSQPWDLLSPLPDESWDLREKLQLLFKSMIASGVNLESVLLCKQDLGLSGKEFRQMVADRAGIIFGIDSVNPNWETAPGVTTPLFVPFVKVSSDSWKRAFTDDVSLGFVKSFQAHVRARRHGMGFRGLAAELEKVFRPDGVRRFAGIRF